VISIAFCTSVWIFAVFFPNLHCNRPLLKSLQTKLFVSLRLWKLSVDPRLTVCEVCAIGGELGLSFDIAKTHIARGRGWYAHPQLHVDDPPRRAQRRGFPKSMLLIIILMLEKFPSKGLEFFKYMYTVRMAASRGYSLGLVNYDEQHRLRKATSLSSSWGVVDMELWMCVSTPPSGNIGNPC
jgi:hypothetical protein